jgi:hypothetical protein
VRRYRVTALAMVAALALSGCVAAAQAPPESSADAPAVIEPSEAIETEAIETEAIETEAIETEAIETEAIETEATDIPEQGTAEWAALSQDEQIRACETRGAMVGCMLTWGDCWSTTFAAAENPMAVAGELAITPVDRGQREYATGEAVLDASGTPVAYRVAAGDVPEFVADRFCTRLAYLNGINSVRRASLANNLYTGDTLN